MQGWSLYTGLSVLTSLRSWFLLFHLRFQWWKSSSLTRRSGSELNDARFCRKRHLRSEVPPWRSALKTSWWRRFWRFRRFWRLWRFLSAFNVFHFLFLVFSLVGLFVCWNGSNCCWKGNFDSIQWILVNDIGHTQKETLIWSLKLVLNVMDVVDTCDQFH